MDETFDALRAQSAGPVGAYIGYGSHCRPSQANASAFSNVRNFSLRTFLFGFSCTALAVCAYEYTVAYSLLIDFVQRLLRQSV